MPGIGLAAGSMASLAGCLLSTIYSSSAVLLGGQPGLQKRRWARRTLHGLRVDVEVSGMIQPWPRLWVSNHISWLDPIVFMDLGAPDAIAKMEVSRWPLLGPAARKAGIPFVQRDTASGRSTAMSRMVDGLRDGGSFLLFPEATTTDGCGLAPLRPGGLRAAYRLGLPVQALRVSSPDPHYPWTGKDLLFPHLCTLARARGTRVRIQARGVFEPAEHATEQAWIDALTHALEP